MNDSWSSLQQYFGLAAAGLLLLLDLALSTALVAVAALSPVTLRRMSSDNPSRFGFLEHMQQPLSPHRMATITLQQLSLLCATVLLIVVAHRAALRAPVLGGLGAGIVIGVLLVQTILARSLALWRPRHALRATASVVGAAYRILWPLVLPLRKVLQRVDASHALSDEEREENQEQEVEALIEVGERQGLLEAEEGKMMRGIVDLDETLVREIMTPRTAIVALEADLSVTQARRTVLEAGHSRLPVYSGTIDNIVGVLHSRDLFQAWASEEDRQSVGRYVRPAIFVPETLCAADLLAEMRQKTQIALVVDEYGGIAGVVTLEDVLEEIVGDIRDEHDDEEELIRREADGCWVVDAVAHVDELESLFQVQFGEREFDTVGGLVVSGFGRVPRAGETLRTHGLELEVLQADNRRVRKVRVRRDRASGAAADNS